MDFRWEGDILKATIEGIDYCCHTIHGDDSLKIEEFDICFLQSPYYDGAEVDYRIVKMDDNKIGTIFPVSLLADSDEAGRNIIESENFSPLANVTTRLLWQHYLSDYERRKEIKESEICELDVFFDNRLYIFLYRKSKVNNIYDFVQSLYFHGYTILNNDIPYENLYSSDILRNIVEDKKNKGNKNVVIRKNSKLFNLDQHYFSNLFSKVLPFVSDPFYRYLTIYQVYEMQMERITSDRIANSVATVLSQNHEMRNERENLSEYMNEKKNLESMHSEINLNDDIYSNFRFAAINLLKQAGFDDSGLTDYVKCMYKVRNALVHNLRRLLPFEQDMRTVSNMYELTLRIFLDKKQSLAEPPTKKIFIVDKAISEDENVNKMRTIYNS